MWTSMHAIFVSVSLFFNLVENSAMQHFQFARQVSDLTQLNLSTAYCLQKSWSRRRQCSLRGRIRIRDVQS
jgi:hypothetical protein